jgi:hypothetical protein
MGNAIITALVMVLVMAGHATWADDLTGAGRFLCASAQATVCFEDGECAADLPWNLNVPEFIEVDLVDRRLSTTAASGSNRTTPIEHIVRQNGVIVIHGFEAGRAFSWVISETTGRLTATLAADGASVAVFGTCTPLPGAADVAGR